MESKKSKKASLENKRSLFFQIGLALAMGFILLCFEWTTTDVKVGSLGELQDLAGEEEIIPITRQEMQKPPEPPKPQKVILELNIVEDDIELDDEFEIEDFEASQDDEIEIIAMEEEEESEAEIFFIVEDMPTFQGGDLSTFRDYIQSSIDYPPMAMENGISGTVYVNFVVNSKGEIANISIVRGVDPALDNEVIRALKASPKWKPGEQRGIKVSVTMSIPVKFILQ
jgi:protein TonB